MELSSPLICSPRASEEAFEVEVWPVLVVVELRDVGGRHA